MPSSVLNCPACQSRIKSPQRLPDGRSVTCPSCQVAFRVTADNQRDVPGTVANPVAPPVPKKITEPEPELEEIQVMESPRPRSKKNSAKPSSRSRQTGAGRNPLWIGLGVASVLFVVVAAILMMPGGNGDGQGTATPATLQKPAGLTIPAPVALPETLFAHIDPPIDEYLAVIRPDLIGSDQGKSVFTGPARIIEFAVPEHVSFLIDYTSPSGFEKFIRFKSPADLSALMAKINPKEYAKVGDLAFSSDGSDSTCYCRPRPNDLIAVRPHKLELPKARIQKLATTSTVSPRATLALRCCTPLSGYPVVTFLKQPQEKEYGGPTAKVDIPHPGGKIGSMINAKAGLYATLCDSPQAATALAESRAADIAEIVAKGLGGPNPFTYADAKVKSVWVEGDVVFMYWDFAARSGFLR